jgi:hypothetical protein
LKENIKIIIETKENMQIQFGKEAQPLVKEEYEKRYVQQPRGMKKCAGNEEDFESWETTLPLCFYSFKLLKKDVNNVPYQEPSRYDVEYPK